MGSLMTDPIRVVIVDDHAVVRSGLKAYLSSQSGFKVVGEATSGEEAVDRARDHEPDVMLIDLLLPSMDGVEATRRIKVSHPKIKIIILTSFHDDELIFAALQAGATACIFKDMKMDYLIDAIYKATHNEVSINPRIAAMILKKFQQMESCPEESYYQLTDTEAEILSQLANGVAVRRISDGDRINANGVSDNLRNILTKLQKSDQLQGVTK